jgi:uncharacterized protein YjbI with pentapeptide repeats
MTVSSRINLAAPDVIRVYAMKAPLGAALVLLLTVCSQFLRADTPKAQVVWGQGAERVRVGPGMQAQGKQLAGSTFAAQDLSRANFSGCNLFHVTFHECNLSRALFRGTRLTDTRFLDCIIDDVDFTDTVVNGVKFEGTFDFTAEQFKSTRSYRQKDLRNCRIPAEDDSGYDFRDADLTGADAGDLRRSFLQAARIDGIRLDLCLVDPAQFMSTANLRGKHLTNARLSLRNCENIDFSGMSFENVEFSYANPKIDFTDARIRGCRFRRGALTQQLLHQTRDYGNGTLRSVGVDECDLSKCDFSRMNLTGCSFSMCDLANAVFEDAIITDVSFGYKCSGLTVAQIKSTWNYRHKRMEGIILPKELQEALKNE